MKKIIKKENYLSGADAVAYIFKKAGVKYVFAYPGTSELALCDSFIRTPGVTIVNGRGDKESAFMSAGGSLVNAARAVSILHGARGATNASGAIADARRNEISTIYIVGLPSTSSQKYLPPHGENNLIGSIGKFAKHTWEITDTSDATSFLDTIKECILDSRVIPYGPNIIGIPQDIMEKNWIPTSLLNNSKMKKLISKPIDQEKIKEAVNLIKKCKKKVILVDDFLYKDPKAKKFLTEFAEFTNAPIFQVWYRRGPMLFESMNHEDNPHFMGFYDTESEEHKKIMLSSDLLITLEDRNAYERVVGVLPECSKIALTSNSAMTQKNGYLKDGDILIEGTVYEMMKLIAKSVKSELTPRVKVKNTLPHIQEQYRSMRNSIAMSFASVFTDVKQPILIDDSQMFGGILAEYHHLYPSKLRIFGDHGAFIGGGMATAAGLSFCETKSDIFCTIGDQSFINAVQALVFVSQTRPNITYVVCNNGKSVSLTKQALSQDISAIVKGKSSFLDNVHNLSYTAIANAFGLVTHQIECDPSLESPVNLQKELTQALKEASSKKGPILIELMLPSRKEAWEGIWNIKGNETVKPLESKNI